MKKMNRIFALTFLSVLSLSVISCGKKSAKNLHPRGLANIPENYEAVPMKPRLLSRDYDSLPSSVILRPYTPTPESQGQYGTCGAWSVAYCAMTTTDSVAMQRTNSWTSSQNAFSPFYLYRTLQPYDTYASYGLDLATALNFVKTNGLPYRNSSEKNDQRFEYFNVNSYAGAKLYKIESYARLYSDYNSQSQNISAIKKSISQKKPVILAIYCPDSLDNTGKYWNPSSYERSRKTSYGGHGIVCVGYDDNVNGGSLLIQNSWGSDWADGGYCWFKYADANEFIYQAFEMTRGIVSFDYQKDDSSDKGNNDKGNSDYKNNDYGNNNYGNNNYDNYNYGNNDSYNFDYTDMDSFNSWLDEIIDMFGLDSDDYNYGYSDYNYSDYSYDDSNSWYDWGSGNNNDGTYYYNYDYNYNYSDSYSNYNYDYDYGYSNNDYGYNSVDWDDWYNYYYDYSYNNSYYSDDSYGYYYYYDNCWKADVNAAIKTKSVKAEDSYLPADITIYKGSVSLPVWNSEESIEVEFKDGVYQTKEPLYTGDKFQVQLKNDSACYVYAFASDEATGKATPIFPRAGESALLDYAGNSIVYPGENSYIKANADAGTDYLIIIYSLKELNLEEIMLAYEHQVKNGMDGKKNFYTRVARSISEEIIINPGRILFGRKSIDFEAKSNNSDRILVVPLAITHK